MEPVGTGERVKVIWKGKTKKLEIPFRPEEGTVLGAFKASIASKFRLSDATAIGVAYRDIDDDLVLIQDDEDLEDGVGEAAGLCPVFEAIPLDQIGQQKQEQQQQRRQQAANLAEANSAMQSRAILALAATSMLVWLAIASGELRYYGGSGFSGGEEEVRPKPLSYPDALQKLAKEIEQSQADMCRVWERAGAAPEGGDCALIKRGWVGNADNGSAIVDRLTLYIVQGRRGELANFTVAVMGSSTSAGHDSHLNYTYAVQAQQLMEEPFRLAGLRLDVRNQAMGGWDYRAGTMYCLDNLAGPDPDVVFWEWGCFSPTACSEEVYARAAFSMARRPEVVFLEKFGGGAPGAMWHSLAYFRMQRNKSLIGPYMEHASCFPKKAYVGPAERFLDSAWLRAFNEDSSECSAERRDGERWYREHEESLHTATSPGLAEKEQKNWEDKHESFAKGHAKYYKTYGFQAYRMTAGTTYDLDHKPWWMYRMSLFRVVHHAGVLGHLLTGHQVSYAFLGFLNKALGRVEQAARDNTLGQLKKEMAGKFEVKMKAQLPAKKLCGYPSMEYPRARPLCYTTFLPRLGPGLNVILPKLKNGSTDYGKWHNDFAEDHQKTGFFRNPKNGDYKDKKGDVSATRENGWIRFRIPAREAPSNKTAEDPAASGKAAAPAFIEASLIVCHGRGDLANIRDADLKVDGKLWYLGTSTKDIKDAPLKSRPIGPVLGDDGSEFGRACALVGTVDASKSHTLSMRAGEQKLQISHVILA